MRLVRERAAWPPESERERRGRLQQSKKVGRVFTLVVGVTEVAGVKVKQRRQRGRKDNSGSVSLLTTGARHNNPPFVSPPDHRRADAGSTWRKTTCFRRLWSIFLSRSASAGESSCGKWDPAHRLNPRMVALPPWARARPSSCGPCSGGARDGPT